MKQLAAFGLLIGVTAPTAADPQSANLPTTLAESYVVCAIRAPDLPLGYENGCSLGFAVASGWLYRNDFRSVDPENICRLYLEGATEADVEDCLAGYEIGVSLALRERGRR